VIHPGELVGLLGPNGSGKTTAVNLISGFVRPDSGRVFLGGLEVTGLSPNQRTRQGMARCFQAPRVASALTVLQNVLLWFRGQPGEQLKQILVNWGKCRRAEEANIERATEILCEFGLDACSDQIASTCSYGQQRLLTIVCCLAANPTVILLDEPVAGIAPEMSARVLSLIRRQADSGRAVLMIEHNMAAISSVCDRAICLEAGSTICVGTPDEVLTDRRVLEAYLG